MVWWLGRAVYVYYLGMECWYGVWWWRNARWNGQKGTRSQDTVDSKLSRGVAHL